MILKNEFPKITVVTPNYNQAKFLELTIQSVLNQNYPNLEYIIIDGGSTDASLEIIKKYESKLAYWISEQDNGMYDAINKGFEISTGEIMCWINSDDVLWEGSLNYIANIFVANTNIRWLQGFPSVIDEKGDLLFQRNPINSKYYFYLLKHEKDFSFIQQESTFWTRDLWERAGGHLNVNYALAADFDLWMRFFNFEALYCTKRQLAAFRKRKGQNSGDYKTYLLEAKKSVDNSFRQLSFFDKFKINISKKLGIKYGYESINWID
ncbi:glycosyltransferase family 2 protein [uncultured Algibacter sp.]|uniref:glycosyltransferase family 2 protein n=1 Tax=uncultured Algibacter sp. TaxID=298659 RepID=UPI00262FADCB|nr:glycosyltransferase family 2 protein [uncultured Algibacter sp.]